MDRDNATWVGDLSGPDPRRAAALADLRVILVRGLERAFPDQRGIDAALIEDMAQDVLLKVLNGLGTFQGKSRFTTWALAIAIRATMTEVRRRRWKDVSLEQMMAAARFPPELAVDPNAGPERQAEQRDLLEATGRIIAEELTPKQRAVLLAELDGMPQEEIGRRMGSNRNAIYKLTHDARKRLRAGLERAGYSGADVAAAFAG